MYFKRNIETSILEWLNRPKRQILIVRGARQVGKSTTIRQTLRQAAYQLIEVNLEEHFTYLKPLFDSGTPQEILDACSRLTGIPIQSPGSLQVLFLDEIQAIPSALTAIRYLNEFRPDLPPYRQ